MCLGLFGDRRAGDADLSLDGGDALAGDLADGFRDARRANTGARLSAELLDARRDAALVVPRLLQVLLEALLVRRLLGEADMSGQIRFELRLLGVSFVQELDQFGVTSIEFWHVVRIPRSGATNHCPVNRPLTAPSR